MDDKDIKYLTIQFQEGSNTIRFYVECRYKILQFVGFYNAAVLTFGFGQEIFSFEEGSPVSLPVCVLSVMVAIMGLVTEFSLTSYTSAYYEILRQIENKLSNPVLIEKKGIYSHGHSVNKNDLFNKILPVSRAHRLFYLILLFFWIIFSFYQGYLYLKV